MRVGANSSGYSEGMRATTLRECGPQHYKFPRYPVLSAGPRRRARGATRWRTGRTRPYARSSLVPPTGAPGHPPTRPPTHLRQCPGDDLHRLPHAAVRALRNRWRRRQARQGQEPRSAAGGAALRCAAGLRGVLGVARREGARSRGAWSSWEEPAAFAMGYAPGWWPSLCAGFCAVHCALACAHAVV